MAKRKKNNKEIKLEIVQKFYLLYIVILLFAIIIIGQILFLQIFKKEKLEKKAATTRIEEVEANRGDICDINGRLLATSIPYYEIRMDTKCPKDSLFFNNVDSLAYCLSEYFGNKTKEEYLEKLLKAREEGNQYLFIGKNLTHNELKEIKKFPIFNKGKYKGGIIAEPQTTRVLPHDLLASRLIGYYNEETKKNVGIEGAFDEELRGKNGFRFIEKMSGGDWRPIKFDNEVEPQDGKEIISTIDINIQDLVETTLLNQLLKLKAKYGVAVLMEVKTGEVRAIANLEKINDSTYIEKFNHAIGTLYEPGSTFKLPAIMAAFENSDIQLDEIVDTKNGILKIKDFVMKDSKKGGYGKITVQQAFELSSNIGISGIIYDQFGDNPEKFLDRLYSMTLNEPLEINDIAGEKEPEIKYPDDAFWSGVSLRQMAIGYELKVTAIQMLAFYNAIANNGVMIKPFFVKAIREHGEIVEEFETEVISTSICSKKTLKKVKTLLEGVVENGTATNLKSENFKIAGKTGTSQIAYGSGGYTTEEGVEYNASFVGYYPADNPKYSCIVVVNSPKEIAFYGGQAAGPIFKEIAEKLYTTDYDMQSDKIFDIENLEDVESSPKVKSGFSGFIDIVFKELEIDNIDKTKTSDWVKVANNDSIFHFSDINVEKGIVPNVIGMGAREAIYLLENRGLKVIVDGRGTVKNQSIPAGSVILQGKSIKITLS